MGLYINKGNEGFRQIRNSEYVDKSGLISVVNKTLFTERKMSCVTRCRRFGKSIAAKMLCAYYDHSCDSRQLFADLEIAGSPTFEEHLNKYPVIYVDMTAFTSGVEGRDVVGNIQRALIADISAAYPQVPYTDGDHLMIYLQRVVAATGDRFVMIIDEWDAVIRIYDDQPEVKDSFVDLLRRMFKDVAAVDVFAGVYMTGILPIKKYKTESALNNFIEYSMVEPRRMARYFGFTKDEVRCLAEKYDMDFDDLEKWYDGYQIGSEPSMFNPNSVMQAIDAGWCRSYWTTTGSFEAVTNYINLNFDGLRDGIVRMLAGSREKVDPTRFQNDMSIVKNRDDVYTVLIHLGYLSYDRQHDECYIPNKEVGSEMLNAVRENRWQFVTRALDESERLLEATLRCDADYVAAHLEELHAENTSIFRYNDENALSCVISIAYYYARNDYYMLRELPTGKGYADIVFLPRKNVAKPALVIELKKDSSARAAIDQIHERCYPQQVEHYSGEMLLVGINYDAASKQHTCRIERWEK
jgi:hypothetical protein